MSSYFIPLMAYAAERRQPMQKARGETRSNPTVLSSRAIPYEQSNSNHSTYVSSKTH